MRVRTPAQKEAQRRYEKKYRDRVREMKNAYKRTPAGRYTNRKYWIKMRYGITIEQFEQMRAAQNNRCDICGDELPVGRNIHIDHDHATNKVRGLLCHVCNMGLGSFKDSPLRLQAAIHYLHKWNSVVKV